MISLRLLFKKYFRIYRPYFILTHYKVWANRYLVNENTSLCLEGFQSSGNSFLNALLNHLNPDIQVAHHTHSLANVRQALKKSIPVVVLIRHPLEAVSSRISRFSDNSLADQILKEYIDYYQYILKYQAAMIIIPFETLVGNLSTVVTTISERSNIPFDTSDLETKVTEVKTYIQVWSDEHGDQSTISLPTRQRENHKKEIQKHITTLSSYKRALSCYEAIRDALR